MPTENPNGQHPFLFLRFCLAFASRQILRSARFCTLSARNLKYSDVRYVGPSIICCCRSRNFSFSDPFMRSDKVVISSTYLPYLCNLYYGQLLRVVHLNQCPSFRLFQHSFGPPAEVENCCICGSTQHSATEEFILCLFYFIHRFFYCHDHQILFFLSQAASLFPYLLAS